MFALAERVPLNCTIRPIPYSERTGSASKWHAMSEKWRRGDVDRLSWRDETDGYPSDTTARRLLAEQSFANKLLLLGMGQLVNESAGHQRLSGTAGRSRLNDAMGRMRRLNPLGRFRRFGDRQV